MRYAKAIVAIVTTMLLAAQTIITMPTAAHGWVTVVLAGLGAFGVYQVRNDREPVPPVPPRPAPQFFDPNPQPPTIAPPVPGRYPPTP